MLQFIEEHPDLAQNRIQGLEARKQTVDLWEQLANELNSCDHGITKSIEKWIKVYIILYIYIYIYIYVKRIL